MGLENKSIRSAEHAFVYGKFDIIFTRPKGMLRPIKSFTHDFIFWGVTRNSNNAKKI